MKPPSRHEKLSRKDQDLEGQLAALRQTVDSLKSAEQFARTVLNSLSAHIAILDENGVILETNRSWQEFAVANQMSMRPETVGVNYLEVCDGATGESVEGAHEVARGIRAVIAGELREFAYNYPCHSPEKKHWFYVRARQLSGPGSGRVVVSHENVTALKLAEEAVRARERELEEHRRNLEETNTALRVLLKRREEDKAEIEENLLANTKELVEPYLDKLKNTALDAQQEVYLEIMEFHLKEIISPFLRQLSSKYLSLTPKEIQVANLVRVGKDSQEIADILNVSTNAVNFHRQNIRKKLGLKKTGANLRSHLLSLLQ
jgi:DNA-binding CsgD family transcriptional regulator